MLMRKLYTLIIAGFLFTISTNAQFYQQYFDGADTNSTNSIIVDLTTDTNSIWQVGSPQKTIFHSAATAPNAIITDTVNFYPVNDTSSFYYRLVNPTWMSWGIFALQWMQKIDYDYDHDGGMIEYSIDAGTNWTNVFNDPYVYSFYGFDSLNVDTMSGTNYGFSGTDTTWRNIWLCFDMSFFSVFDTIDFKFTSISDSVNNNKEGWMIDNMMAQITFVHTVKSEKMDDYLKIFPTPTNGIIYIEAEKQNGFHIIEWMELTDIQGRVVKKYGKSPTKFNIDISDLPDGNYYLRIKTNLQEKTLPVILNKNR